MERLLVAGIILITFFILIFVALEYSKTLYHMSLYPALRGGNVMEHFSAPTTAADCRCLPGYVPSNMKSTTHKTGYFCQNLQNPAQTAKCY